MAEVFRFDFLKDGDNNESDYDNYEDSTISEHTNFPRPTQIKAVNRAVVETPKLHTLQEMIPTLPDQMSYAEVYVRTQQGQVIQVLRREVFDIRAQLMAEDSLGDQGLIEGLSKDDITPGLYEGGFKTWECSIDLASYILSQPQIEDHIQDRPWHIIELGAGSALPTLVLFNLRNNTQIPEHLPFFLTVADYNPPVLHLATIPNLIINHDIRDPASARVTNPNADHGSFEQTLSSQNIHISAISGPWGEAFNTILQTQSTLYKQALASISHPHPETLILASETIYSPNTIPSFISTLVHLLRTAAHDGGIVRALVAAKRYYFGVGGGVDDFLAALPGNGLNSRVVWETEGEGVGRVILEVTLAGWE